MTIRPDITAFVRDLELYSKHRLNYPLEVSELLQIVVQTGIIDEFEEVIFISKFLVRAQEVLKRIGHETEGFNKLSAEFQSNIKRMMNLLNSFAGRADEALSQKYASIFLTPDIENVDRLVRLCSDLSWVKNWQIDGKPLPFESRQPKITVTQEVRNLQTGEKHQTIRSPQSLLRIQRSAVLSVILIILFLFIDPPVTILGWMLAVGIAGLIAYIIVQTTMLRKNPD
ncbi:MAG: hypothetical protein EHM64_06860 [Ignavibacteriae bacterium]|nr:MAG: hypothetical protein EHM64_06860 [Ignavibacteriota bacterium]